MDFDYKRVGTFTVSDPEGNLLPKTFTDLTYAFEAALRHALVNEVDGTYTINPPKWTVQTMGFGARSENPGDVLPPTVPVVTATRTGPQEITVTWGISTDVSGVSKYLVKQSAPTSSAEVEVAAGAARSRVYSGLAANASHQFQVRAQDIYGNLSSYGTSNSVTTLPINVAPVWTAIPAWSLPYNTGGTLDVKPFVSDANGDALTISLVNPPAGYTITNGVINANASVAAGTLSLSASDGTLTATTTVAVTVSGALGTIKWNPGHYFQLFRSYQANQWSNKKAVFDMALAHPLASAWKGFTVNYTWGELQPTNSTSVVLNRDGVTWTGIQQDLEYLAARGKKLWIRINDGPYVDKYNNTWAWPQWFINLGYTYDRTNGSMWKRYIPAAAAYYKNLHTLLANTPLTGASAGYTLNTHPAVEGITLWTESAGMPVVGGTNPVMPPGYTTAADKAGLVDIAQHGQSVWTQTNVRASVNFWGWYTGTVAELQAALAGFAGSRVGFGGPDMIPLNYTYPITGMQTYIGQSGGTDLRGAYPYFGGIEASEMGYDSVGAPGGYSASTLNAIARDTMRASHLFWDFMTDATKADPNQLWNGTGGIIETMNSQPLTNTTQPSTYTGGAVSETLRWAPGHYAQPGLYDTAANITTQIDGMDSRIRGVLVRRFWKDIETSKGVYNWADLDTIHTKCLTVGKKLIIRLQTRAFGTTNPLSAVPQYLVDESLTYSRSVVNNDAAGAAIWLTACKSYEIALCKKIIDRYGSSAALVALTGEETSLGPSLPASYTASGYLTEEIRHAQELRAYAPHLAWILYTNWWNQDIGTAYYTQQFIAYARSDKGVWISGGPDMLTGITPSDGHKVITGAIGGIDHRGVYGIHAQSENYEWSRGVSVADVYNDAYNTYQANYMVWGTYYGNWSTIYSYLSGRPARTTVPSQLVGFVEVM